MSGRCDTVKRGMTLENLKWTNAKMAVLAGQFRCNHEEGQRVDGESWTNELIGGGAG